MHASYTSPNRTVASFLPHAQIRTALPGARRTRLRSEQIGFVFQAFHLVAHKTALSNVILPLIYKPAPRRSRRRAATEALTKVGLAHRVHAMPRTLSGGEKQRVAIARATCYSPTLLLCDEPSGNLDTATSNTLVRMLRELTCTGLAIFLVPHDVDIAKKADRLLQVRDGKLTELDRSNAFGLQSQDA
ncbi:ABC transporter ATP-binding protein [Actinomadura sp. 9N215]|uniref:ABC transporter ATP-binding protein n=1 Tax=Actinomadura sp. 9N215 TaxID=3375150 RepID=UPI0037B6F7AE